MVKVPNLIGKMPAEIKKLITHIDDDARYEEILAKLNATNPDYFDPIETNQRIQKIQSGEPVARMERKTSLFYLLTTPLRPLAWLINKLAQFDVGVKLDVHTVQRFG